MTKHPVSLVCLAVLLAGCATGAGPLAESRASFALTSAGGAAPAEPSRAAEPPAAAAPLTPVAAPAAAAPKAPAVVAPAPVVPQVAALSGGGSGGGGYVQPDAGGGNEAAVSGPAAPTLEVGLAGFLARFGITGGSYHVLATTALDHVTIVVSQDGQPDQTQTLAASNLHGALTNAAFTNVAVGNATITISAYDADNNLLGSSVQHAAVAAGQTNKVDTAVALGHGDVQTVDTPLAADPDATGTAAAPQSGTVLASQLGYMPAGGRLFPGPDGSVLYLYIMPSGIPGDLRRRYYVLLGCIGADNKPNTQLGYSAGFLGSSNDFAFIPGGGVWVSTLSSQLDLAGKTTLLGFPASGVALLSNGDGLFGGTSLIRVTQAGVKSTTTLPGGGPVAVDAQDNVWTGQKGVKGLSKYALDGTLAVGVTLPFEPHQLAFDHGGNLWALDSSAGNGLALITPGSNLAKIAPDGTVLGTYAAAGRQMAPDADGNLWLSGPQLTKLAPDGTVLTTVPLDTMGVAVATDGMVWVTGTKTRKLYKLAP